MTQIYWVKFRKGSYFDLFKIDYAHVFWHANYEYDSENRRKLNFQGQNLFNIKNFSFFLF